MTANHETGRKRKRERITPPSFGSFFLCFTCVFLLALLVRNADTAIQYLQTGLRLCAVSVIPSLFPFMVISELLVASGIGRVFERWTGRIFSRLFGISGKASAAVLLGALCGFPVGAKTAVSLYDKGMISQKETQRILTFCNIPSSGFLISTVGIALFSNRPFGIFLYGTALLAAVLTGIVGRIVYKTHRVEATRIDEPPPRVSVSTFTSAVSSATSSMLSVCAYVIFFSSIVGCLSHAIHRFSLPAALSSFLFAFFEISSGVSAAAALSDPSLASLVCGFAVGWSGLSVHFQILSLCKDRGLSFTPYFLSKLFQGIFCATASFLYVNTVSPAFSPTPQTVSAILLEGTHLYKSLLISLVFFLCAILTLGKRRKKRTSLQ